MNTPSSTASEIYFILSVLSVRLKFSYITHNAMSFRPSVRPALSPVLSASEASTFQGKHQGHAVDRLIIVN